MPALQAPPRHERPQRPQWSGSDATFAASQLGAAAAPPSAPAAPDGEELHATDPKTVGNAMSTNDAATKQTRARRKLIRRMMTMGSRYSQDARDADDELLARGGTVEPLSS
jgi:hypothetical protein